MIGLCLALGLACAQAERPPPVDPYLPAARVSVARPALVGLPVTRPDVRPPDGFPMNCARVPPPELRRIFVNASRRNPSVSACELAKQAWCESNFDTGAVSPAGAKGIAQFLDPTAREMGVSNPFDAGQAIPAMARYVAWSRDAWSPDDRTHDEVVGLGGCTYNLGRGACYRNQREHGWYRLADALPHWPEETRNYTPCILTGERKR